MLDEFEMTDHLNIFPWNDNFEVGCKDIDDQHKKLVEIINQICICTLSDENKTVEIGYLFAELIDYTQYHFEFEEKYYEENGLPTGLCEGHRSHHSHLVDEIFLLKQKYDDDASKTAGLDELLSLLVLWLANHILKDDMRMNSILSFMKPGVETDEAERLADVALSGSKGSISKIVVSMTNVSNASFKELRREIKRRREVEEELKSEIYTRKKAEKELERLALHDGLTGLPNRILFEQLIIAALNIADREKRQQAVLFVDIDGFKNVNDTLGHKAGDSLLKAISTRLEDSIRAADVVARIGGDEFVIHIGGNCNKNKAELVASKIVESLSSPFNLDEGTANVGASVGIALYPKDGKDAETLLKNSDAAMYAAKKSGKNSYRLYRSK